MTEMALDRPGSHKSAAAKDAPGSTPRGEFVLEVEDLAVDFALRKGSLRAVDGVSFSIRPGEMLGLVGESGSGKSVTSLAIAGLIGYMGGQVSGGSVRLNGREILSLTPKQRSDVLGRELGMIFQQPIRSLNPTMRIGDQIAEVVRRHRGQNRSDAWKHAVTMLEKVHVPDAANRAKQYPHMFSGGMSQRVMIAMALACDPSLLIADEPTTALDVTVQKRVLDLLQEVQGEFGIGLLLITHDLGVISQVCQRIAVMYCGQIVEIGPVADVMSAPSHPYTEGLIQAIPSKGSRERLVAIPGTVPALDALPPGCRFHPRCPYSQEGLCDTTPPLLDLNNSVRLDRCHHPEKTRKESE